MLWGRSASPPFEKNRRQPRQEPSAGESGTLFLSLLFGMPEEGGEAEKTNSARQTALRNSAPDSPNLPCLPSPSYQRRPHWQRDVSPALSQATGKRAFSRFQHDSLDLPPRCPLLDPSARHSSEPPSQNPCQSTFILGQLLPCAETSPKNK